MAIASAAYAALDREPGGVDYSALLDETGHAGGDPHRAARAASDRHDELMRKLEAERSQRDDVEAKRARLADTLAVRDPGLARRRLRPRPPRHDRGAAAPVRARRIGRRLRATAIWRATCRPSAPGARAASSFRVDLGLRQPGAAAHLGDCRLRAGLRHSSPARRRGDRRDRRPS